MNNKEILSNILINLLQYELKLESAPLSAERHVIDAISLILTVCPELRNQEGEYKEVIEDLML